MRPADLTTVLRDYLAGWNADDADTRHTHLGSAVYRDEIVYLDPHIDKPVGGLSELESHVASFRSAHPHKLEAALPADSHNDVLRTRWRFKHPETDEVLSQGILFADIGKDGRLTRVIHFEDARS